MAAIQLRTFADLYTAVMEELKVQSTDTVNKNRIKRIINMVYLDEVVPYEQWKWIRESIDVVHEPRINAGTASVTANSSTVTLTIAPGTDRTGHLFSTDGYNEVYRIASHSANSTTLVLESPYTGATNSSLSYKIWTDRIALPTKVRDTIQVRHDFLPKPLENQGMQKLRELAAIQPKAEARPSYYSTDDKKDPAPYSTISGLPAAESRSSVGVVKTLTFASSVEDYLEEGASIEVTAAGELSYNGRWQVSSVSSDTITFTGTLSTAESTTADTAFVVKLLNNEKSIESAKDLVVFPAIFSSRTTLHVDFAKDIPPLEEDDDEPLIPLTDRNVLYYGALMIAWRSIGRNPEEAQTNAGLYERKLSKMQGKLDDSTDMPRLLPSKLYLGSKRNASRQRDSRYGLQNWGSSSGGQQNFTGSSNSVAVFDSSGNLTASTSISTNELEWLNDNEGLQSFSFSDNQSSSQLITSWAWASYTSFHLIYSINRGASGSEEGTFHIVTDGSSVGYSQHGASFSAPGVNLVAAVSGSDIQLRYTSTATGLGGTLKYKIQKWLA